MKTANTTRTPTTSVRRHRRLTLVPLALALAFGAAACGDDAVEPEAADEVAAGDTATGDPISIEEDASLEGLEVTVTGNVDEVVDDHAFRLDKDGLGEEDGPEIGDLPDEGDDLSFVDDANYYDYDYYTVNDDELGEGEDQGLLVFDPAASPVTAEQAVQVSGTIRHFDLATIEDYYDVDLDETLYEPFAQEYMLLADRVTTADPSDAGDASDSTTEPTSSETGTEDAASPSATATSG